MNLKLSWMQKNHQFRIVLIMASVLAVGGCDKANQQVDLTVQVPETFQGRLNLYVHQAKGAKIEDGQLVVSVNQAGKGYFADGDYVQSWVKRRIVTTTGKEIPEYANTDARGFCFIEVPTFEPPHFGFKKMAQSFFIGTEGMAKDILDK